jgi:putative transposase
VPQRQWARVYIAPVPAVSPWRSPESNGLAEAFFGSFKRDYVYQACLETLEDVAQQMRAWIELYNHQASHSALDMRAPSS